MIQRDQKKHTINICNLLIYTYKNLTKQPMGTLANDITPMAYSSKHCCK